MQLIRLANGLTGSFTLVSLTSNGLTYISMIADNKLLLKYLSWLLFSVEGYKKREL